MLKIRVLSSLLLLSSFSISVPVYIGTAALIPLSAIAGTCDGDNDPPDSDDASHPQCQRPDGPKNNGNSCPSDGSNDGEGQSCGNPINPTTGNKTQQEVDYHGMGVFPLKMVRQYNSGSSITAGPLGANWTHGYNSRIAIVSATQVKTIRGDEKTFSFNLVNNVWTPDADVNSKLEKLAAGWRYTTSSHDLETYNAQGQLVTITNRAGIITQRYGYDAAGHLITVSDPFGKKLVFAYDSQGRILTMTDPIGYKYSYHYDAKNNLDAVTYPGGAVRKYLYENSLKPHALTGLIDENGSRFATWTYNGDLAVSSEHAGGAEKVTISYDLANLKTTVTNALGATQEYSYRTYYGVSHLAFETRSCPNCTPSTRSMTYDNNGNRLTSTDFIEGTLYTNSKGNLTCYAYDSRNLETVRVEGFAPNSACPGDLVNYTPTPGTAQRKISTQWHATWRVPVRIVEPKRITTYSWGNTASTCGAAGVLCGKTEQSNGLTRSHTYTYNAYGQILTENGPRPDDFDAIDKTTYVYYANTDAVINNRQMLKTVTNGLNQTTTYSNYDAHGYARRIVDANNVITDIVRDARSRIYTVTITAPGAAARATNFRYYPNGLLSQVITPNQGTILYTYDAAHRLRSIANGANEKVSYPTLDALGNRIQEKTFAPAATTASTVINRQFDVFGRLWKVLNAANQEVQVYGYDVQNNRTSVTAKPDANSAHDQLTSYTNYDALNRLTELKDAILGVTNLGYDGLDHLVSVKDPRSHTTSYAIDGLDNQLKEVSPDRGATSSTDAGAFDEAGNLKIKTDARGKTTRYTYDALNRLLSETYADSSSVKYQYDIGTGAKGRLNNITDPTGTTNFVYDTEGRLKSKKQTTGTVARSVTYGYDSAGRLNSITYPSGLVVKYNTFDAAGRVTSLSVAGTVVLDTVKYQPLSGVKSYRLPTVTGQPVIGHGYDANGYIASYTLADANKVLQRDRLGNVTGIRNAAATTWDSVYTYDKLNRLTNLTITSLAQNYGYVYDGLGNRISKTANSSTTTYTINAANNRFSTINGVTQVYDAAGNLTGNGTMTWGYNARGRLTNVNLPNGRVYNYGINGLGQRVTKTSAAIATGRNIYVYDEAGHLIGEYNNSGARLWEHVYLGDMPVAVINSAGTVFYVLTDHLNTPRQVINTAKQLRWRWDNTEPFGANTANQNPAGLGAFAYNLRFPGQYYDSESGLHYNAFRDYDPNHGRYLESDPIGLSGGLNTFGYVGGNPVNQVDLFGLMPGLYCASCHNPFNSPPVPSSPSDTSNDTVEDIINNISNKAEKARERKEYSRICKTPIKPTGDPCVDAQANKERLEKCLSLRIAFGIKWYNDKEPGHDIKNQEIQTAIDNLDEWLKNNCGKKQCN